MKSSKIVLVQVDEAGDPIRIFRFRKDGYKFPVGATRLMEHGAALSFIRGKIVLRSEGYCEYCGRFIGVYSGHLHEAHPRGIWIDGNLGEYSMSNSVYICSTCHKDDHPEKKLYTSKAKSE